MRISLYFINWNDSFYLPFIKKHYGKFCQRMVMYDNYSTDASKVLARQLGIEVRFFGQKGQLNDQHYLDIKNHCWKEERGKSDYVIVCDADEFVVPINLVGSVPKMKGYNIISDKYPKFDIMELNTGSEDENYAKQAIFDPNKIREINFVHGCHRNHIQGEITTEGSCELRHFRMIGGIDRILRKHSEYRARMSAFNKRHNMGHHYLHTDHQKREEWDYLKRKAIELW